MRGKEGLDDSVASQEEVMVLLVPVGVAVSVGNLEMVGRIVLDGEQDRESDASQEKIGDEVVDAVLVMLLEPDRLLQDRLGVHV